MNRLELTAKLREIISGVVEKQSLELVKVDFIGTPKKPTLRVFIDKPKGISHADCVNVSRAIEEVLDAREIISDAYILEVSSPGLERELYSLQDFQRFAGNLAKVKTKKPIDGQKNFSGRIIGIEGEMILFQDKTNGEVRFTFEEVVKANLEVDLEEEFRRNK